MITLNFDGAPMGAVATQEKPERATVRKERWVRYYGPATVIIGSVLYVIHSWMGIA